MTVSPTHRDIADFFRIALTLSHVDTPLVPLTSIVSWADHIIESATVAKEWMIDLSMNADYNADRASVVNLLSCVPGPATDFLAASILAAFIGRQWRAGILSRHDACVVLAHLREYLPEEHDIAAVVPSATLDDELICISQGMPEQLYRVDNVLSEFLALFEEYERFVPSTC